MKLSVALITHNEQKNLARTLRAVKDIAHEIIVVDSGSTDKTQEIALQFGAKFYTESWQGYGKQKNSAIAKCSGEWILNLDADEEISQKLACEIANIIHEKKGKCKVYQINRTAICFGKVIRYGGWSNQYAVRLFKNGFGSFNDNTVHETFITQEKIGKIRANILHHTYQDLADYLQKFNRYTSEGALHLLEKGKKPKLYKIFLNPIVKFIQMYVLRLGFLDGVEGFVLAVFSASYPLAKYYKFRALWLDKEHCLHSNQD
jgi:glycosyltransferase involved in cell wall biosynthesis